MKVEDINVDNILLDKKLYKNILVYNISYKTFMDAKPLRIRFDKVDGVIKIYDGIRHLELFDLLSEIHDRINSRIYNIILNRIDYLISENSDDKYSIKRDFARVRIDLYNSLLIEKNIDFS